MHYIITLYAPGRLVGRARDPARGREPSAWSAGPWAGSLAGWSAGQPAGGQAGWLAGRLARHGPGADRTAQGGGSVGSYLQLLCGPPCGRACGRGDHRLRKARQARAAQRGRLRVGSRRGLRAAAWQGGGREEGPALGAGALRRGPGLRAPARARLVRVREGQRRRGDGRPLSLASDRAVRLLRGDVKLGCQRYITIQ